MKRHAGFTVIELLVTIVILFTASALFLSQKNRLEASALDDRRKVDINTLHHNLEKVYYATHKTYPRELSEDTLPAVHPDTFKDPSGIPINQQKISPLGIKTGESDYRYEAKGCDQQTGKCTSYILHTNLSLEADYTKHSTHGNQARKK